MLTWGEDVLVYLALPGKLSAPGSLLTAGSSPPAWMLLRLSDPFMACNRVQSREEQKIPGWSGFHAITHPGIPVETNIGYHPMMNEEQATSAPYTPYKCLENVKIYPSDLHLVDTDHAFRYRWAESCIHKRVQFYRVNVVLYIHV